MKDLSVRQICFLFAAVLPVTRMLVYPATLAFRAGHDLVLSALVNYAAEGAVIFLLALLAKKTDTTFFGLLQQKLGTLAARIVYMIFALYFAFSAVLPILEQRGFVLQVLYENVPSFLSFVPFFAVCLYACTKGLRSIGRAADLAFPVFLVCFPVLMFMALPESRLSALLPVGGTGMQTILRGGTESLSWFGTAPYMLFFLGNFRPERKSTAKIISAYAVGAAACLLFLALFYGIFADTAILQQNALAHISKHATSSTSLGRVDLYFVFALTLVLLFALCIPLQMSTFCAAQAIGCPPIFPALAVNAALLAVTSIFHQSYLEIQTFMTQTVWYVFALFSLVLPVSAWLLKIPARGKRAPKGVRLDKK